MIKNAFVNMWNKAYEVNAQNILKMCEKNPKAVVIDLGCADGEWTKKVQKAIKTKTMYGLEGVPEYAKRARKNGIIAVVGDLNNKFPLESNFFDVVHANQVIEHLIKIDQFVDEIYRILKPGGYAIISTENLSSWHNIFATVMGWQPFSHHVSKRFHIGNPLSPHFAEEYDPELFEGLRHNIVFTLYSLKELFEKFGFNVESQAGSGYYPLPNYFAAQDPRHAHFITIKVRKPKTKRKFL